MNVKLEFVIELPEELRAAMSLNGETGLCSWIEGGELHVRIMDDPPEIDDAFDDGFSEGYDAGNEDGYSEGYDAGNEDGYSSGHAAGYDEGLSEGFDRGYDAARVKPRLRNPSREEEWKN